MSDTPETDRLAEEFKRNTLSDDVKLDILFGYTRKLEKGFDEAREALMKIEELFIDGTDIYADREKMGMIARDALERIQE